MNGKLFLYTFILILVSCGCARIYGIKKITHFNQESYDSFLNSLPDSYNYTALISSKEQFEVKIKSGQDEQEKNDFGQPVQILYFIGDNFVSFHANCYARGSLTNLNWNTDDRFSTFIPKSATELINKKDYFSTINKIYPEVIQTGNEYVILIFWTTAFEKISRDAMHVVYENIVKFNAQDKCAIYLINTDNYYAEMFR